MKLIIALMFAFTVLIAATPAPDLAKRAVDCDDCKHRFNFCFNNGRTQGQEGCAETCAQHVVYKTPECRTCGGELGKTPKESRYHKACGGTPC